MFLFLKNYINNYINSNKYQNKKRLSVSFNWSHPQVTSRPHGWGEFMRSRRSSKTRVTSLKIYKQIHDVSQNIRNMGKK